MARHTPGPWTASERDRSYVRIDSDHWAMLATVVVRMSAPTKTSLPEKQMPG